VFVLSLDRDDDRPLPDQVADAIRDRIRDGFLPPGTRLPATRALAGEIGVGRNTVMAAYDRLVGEGWLSSTVGRGTFVSTATPSTEAVVRMPDEIPATRPFSWSRAAARTCRPQSGSATLAGPDGPALIQFAGAVPDASTYPTDEIRHILNDVLRRHGGHALEYGPSAGHPALREFIAARATAQGSPVQPEDVLIIGGLQQGLDLLARLLLEPGDEVAVESPTYANATQIWQLYGATVAGVPMDEGGMRPDGLATVLGSGRTKLVYVMPTFQNPTGLTMDDQRRRQIMEVAREAEVAVLEDHFDSELRYRGVALPPLRAHDSAGQVILLGTFSKILFPGFRLGWMIAPPEARARLLDIKRTGDLATSLLAQMVVAEFCARGGLERHLQRVRRVHAERMAVMLDAIDRHFPPSVTVTRPDGGMTLWVTMPEGSDAHEVREEARNAGVAIAPGTWFFADGGGRRNLRLSFVNETIERIAPGIEQLAGVIERHVERLTPPRPPERRGEEPAPFL